MKSKENLFYDVVHKMKNKQDYQPIIDRACTKYALRTLKIELLTISTILKIYNKIIYQLGIYDRDPLHWHQNEKRLYTWFLVCYQQLQQTSLNNLNQDFFRKVSKIFFQKHPNLLKYQIKNIQKNDRKTKWSQHEDSLLREFVKTFGDKRWNQISFNLFVQSEEEYFRTAKQCRQHWFNHLDQTKIHTYWTIYQDLKLLQYVRQHGKKWSKVVCELNYQRTDHMIKNRFRVLMKRVRYLNRSQTERLSILISQLQKCQNQYKEPKQKKLNHQMQLNSSPYQFQINNQFMLPSIFGFWGLDKKFQHSHQNLGIEHPIGYFQHS